MTGVIDKAVGYYVAPYIVDRCRQSVEACMYGAKIAAVSEI